MQRFGLDPFGWYSVRGMVASQSQSAAAAATPPSPSGPPVPPSNGAPALAPQRQTAGSVLAAYSFHEPNFLPR